jgi:SulP family sulfate permease
MVATAALTLALPVQVAVLAGVMLSAIAAMVQAAADMRVVAIVPGANGRWAEAPAPERLPSRAVTVVQVQGALTFAAADRVIDLLPDPAGSERAVIVIRLRQHVRLNSTLLVVLERYLQRVERAGGRLLLAGIGPEAASQLSAAEALLPGLRADDVFPAEADLGTSTEAAILAGQAWIAASSGSGDAGRHP